MSENATNHIDQLQHKEPIETNIINNLQKTGFPTEIVAGSIMASWGYGVIHSPAYRDHVENKSREFDLRAFKTWSVVDETPKWGLSLYLVAECKKSDTPWVFFTTPELRSPMDWLGDPISLHTNVKSLSQIGAVPEEAVALDRGRLAEVHHYRRMTRMARTYSEPLNKKGPEQIFSAVMSCTKAVIFFESEKSNSRYPTFFYPIIVLSGQMYEAMVAPDKTITLERSSYIQLSHRYLYDAPTHSIFADQAFIIDVVQEDYLPSYLAIIETEMTGIAASLRSSVLKTWKPFQLPNPLEGAS